MRIKKSVSRPVSISLAMLMLLALIGTISWREPALAAPLPPVVTFSNPSRIDINDSENPPTTASPYPSTITVSGQSTVTSLRVAISNMQHTFGGDVDILIVGPTGATCVLMGDTGGSWAFWNAYLMFDDRFPSMPYPPKQVPIYPGTFKPTPAGSFGPNSIQMPNFPAPAPPGPYGTSLSVFNGTDPNGIWKLYVMDDDGGDSGTIWDGWSLNINSGAPIANFEVADCNTIMGWAYDFTQPGVPIDVDIYDNNSLIARVTADKFRQDLLNAGVGNGYHAFSIPTPASLKDGQLHTIRAKYAGTNTDLPGGPKSMSCGGSPPVYQGNHEVTNCNTISGWAWDINQPNTPISVNIYDDTDGSLIATVVADQFRQDLLNAGIGNGAHGFTFKTPVNLKQGLSRPIRVKFTGSTLNLSNTPLTLASCPYSDFGTAGYFETANCNTISGWAWNPSYPNYPVDVELRENGNVLAAGIASVYRQDLLNAGVGNGYHGFSIPTPASLKDGQPHTIKVNARNSGYLVGSQTITCSP